MITFVLLCLFMNFIQYNLADVSNFQFAVITVLCIASDLNFIGSFIKRG